MVGKGCRVARSPCRTIRTKNPRPIDDQAARLLLYAVPKPINSLLTMAAPHATAPVGDVNVNLPETVSSPFFLI
jgi:hypothetical protein